MKALCICFTFVAHVLPLVITSAWSPLTHHVFSGRRFRHHRSTASSNGLAFDRHKRLDRTPRSSIKLAVSETRRDTTSPSSSSSSTDNDANNDGSAQNENTQLKLRTLYPPINATSNGTLQVDSTHTLYYEQYGKTSTTATSDDDGDDYSGDVHVLAKKNALFLHGGPGAGCFPNHARFFSPGHYFVTLFDQRGCGRSAPRGETKNNTLAHLVQDCEALRIHLGVEKWDVVLGGSWGTTLALAYAQTHPSSVGSMILRGVCLFRPQEIDWLFASNGGAARLSPEGWKEFEKAVGIECDESNSDNGDDDADSNRAALHRYYDCLLGSDPQIRLHAMREWMKWEMSIFGFKQGNQSNTEVSADSAATPSLVVWNKDIGGWSFQDTFGPIDEGQTDQLAIKTANSLRKFTSSPASASPGQVNGAISQPRQVNADAKHIVDAKLPPNVTAEQAAKFIPAQAMLTCFYSTNDRYVMHPYNLLSPECILVDRIQDIPCIAIQGAKDTICPPDTALDLSQVWPEMELRVVLNGGHSMYGEDMCSEIVKATDRFSGVQEAGRID